MLLLKQKKRDSHGARDSLARYFTLAEEVIGALLVPYT